MLGDSTNATQGIILRTKKSRLPENRGTETLSGWRSRVQIAGVKGLGSSGPLSLNQGLGVGHQN